ncbi:hypothetical protein RND81_04G059000 [Saponaria officinalis]|uniref:Uncharacterized protein n=1 Tax=Saponaria officinalis TaxID=3572 RepID=A0AAW1LIY2_SAPOF
MLKFVQFCSGLLKERLKQTMIDQELVFIGQVFEHHRLYGIQIAIIEEIKQRGFDNYNSFFGADSCPVKLNDQVKCPMVSQDYHLQLHPADSATLYRCHLSIAHNLGHFPNQFWIHFVVVEDEVIRDF